MSSCRAMKNISQDESASTILREAVSSYLLKPELQEHLSGDLGTYYIYPRHSGLTFKGGGVFERYNFDTNFLELVVKKERSSQHGGRMTITEVGVSYARADLFFRNFALGSPTGDSLAVNLEGTPYVRCRVRNPQGEIM